MPSTVVCASTLCTPVPLFLCGEVEDQAGRGTEYNRDASSWASVARRQRCSNGDQNRNDLLRRSLLAREVWWPCIALLVSLFMLMEPVPLSADETPLAASSASPASPASTTTDPEQPNTEAANPEAANRVATKAEAANPETVSIETDPVRAGFLAVDLDEDQFLSLEEYLKKQPAAQQDVRRQEFLVCDFDGDGLLSFDEYRAMPVVRSRLASVPDPVFERAETEIASALTALHTQPRNDNGHWSEAAWDVACAERWFVGDFAAFDHDGDGFVSETEVRTAFEIAFGIRDAGGPLLRREDGGVLVRQTLLGVYDSNQDGRLSREEFVPRYWGGPEAAETLFAELDADADGLLTISELVEGEAFWHPVLRRFLRLDLNRDGRVDRQELEQGLAGWERPYLEWTFTAFDLDNSEALSLSEYRHTPLANPLLDWRGRRRDLDGDGCLSLDEFHPGAGWPFKGLSLIYFERLDRDGNGLLDLSEFSFDIDLEHVPAEVLFLYFDRNQDGKLTQAEFLPNAVPEGFTVTQLLPFTAQLWVRADLDRDAELDSSEFVQFPDLQTAWHYETRLLQEFWQGFSQKDSNGDGILSRMEWLQHAPSEQAARLQEEFLLCDFNQDGQLSWGEYCCLPSVAAVHQRGIVPDPYREVLLNLEQAIRLAQYEQSDPFIEQADFIAETLGFLSTAEVLKWDRNRDQVFSPSEIRIGLEEVFGFRHPSGMLLKRWNGQVFDLRTFRSYDENNDGRLSLTEFEKRYWEGPEKSREVFAQADLDGDGWLTLAELETGDLLWIDTFQLFRKFDRDRDGSISLAELRSSARSWETQYVSITFPEIDADGQSSSKLLLGIVEFRGTPFANPFEDWNRRRKDPHNQGFLLLATFHDSPSKFALGLSAEYFKRLDRNQDGHLSLRELDFRIDLRRAAASVVFDMFDVNQDGRLSLSEVVSRYQTPVTPTADPEAMRKRQEQVMRLEEAFQAADQDADGALTFAEFTSEDASVFALTTGRPVPRVAATPPLPLARETAVNWRLIGLIGLNGLLLAGIGWFILRP